jgi:pimeloyl-ACP methyl ester carboxylesterase
MEERDTMPNLVCLPGLLCAASVFDPVLRGIGAGGAAWPIPIQNRFDAIVDDLAQALAEDTVVIGHSMGSYLALALALRAPERVVGLVLIGTSAAADSAKAAAMRGKVSDWAERAGMDALGESIADTMLAPSSRADLTLRQRLKDMSVDYGIVAFRAHQEALAGRPDQTSRLSAVACPVLVLSGSEDTVTPPEAGRTLAGAVPDGVFHELDGIGHLPPLECPDRLAHHIRAFLDTLAKDRAA